MAQVRKENTESLEYVCPECGNTFDEGADMCDSCGIEFDWTEEMEYLCPECGTVVDPDQSRCPGCAAKFSMHSDGELTIEFEPDAPPATVEDLLDAAIDESIVRPNGTIVRSEDMEEEVPTLGDGPARPPDDGEEPEDEALDPVEAAPDEPHVDTSPPYVRLYPGGFTLVGFVFAILALLALAFTIVVARYDTWVQGAAEESMGDNQLMIFYMGLAAFAVFIFIAVADLLRTPRARPAE
jgi:predicted RNA-binding Zn-ribbon protein involved in translation (DUF1610 family)